MSKKIICVDINRNRHEVESGELSFRPSVYGILIENNKILMSPQWDGYDFPGGGVNVDETIEDALRREFLEETGLSVKVGEIVHCESSFFVLPYTKKPVNSILIYYFCEKIGGEINIKNFDKYEKEYAKKAEWINLGDIEKIKYINSIDSLKIIKKSLKINNK
ncbi:MAG: NUDIX domain-containing protein [Patescibacteria group bacterium]|nr:NUDIX domain-containing protein [Patescibacteria group bacterium]